jgi:hypothetical protein
MNYGFGTVTRLRTMEPTVAANASQIQRLLSVAVLCPESMTDVREEMLQQASTIPSGRTDS